MLRLLEALHGLLELLAVVAEVSAVFERGRPEPVVTLDLREL
ncbi:hypothetical protein [Caulobacter sp. 17J65-9]|nr:hypothetical protein [Caulobacter sp. 17J65-9]